MKEPQRIECPPGLLQTLLEAREAVLFCHVSPDGDTLGSAQALRFLLAELNVPARLVVDGEAPHTLRVLPGLELFRPETFAMPADAVAVAVDVSSVDRLGASEPLFFSAGRRLVIDHHETNPGFGQENWIDGDAPATAALIYRLYRALGRKPGKEAAICLYAALSTDTGNFLYDSTGPESFEMMAEMTRAGLSFSQYGLVLFRQKQPSFVRLLAQTLPSLRLSQDGRLAGLQTTLQGFEAAGASPEETDGVVDYAIDLEGVCVAYYAHEKQPGVVKVSLRAHDPYRVDRAAASFGGGGHRLAAGCTLRASMPEAVQALENALQEALKERNDS